jgi:hypothetical protein
MVWRARAGLVQCVYLSPKQVPQTQTRLRSRPIKPEQYSPNRPNYCIPRHFQQLPAGVPGAGKNGVTQVPVNYRCLAATGQLLRCASVTRSLSEGDTWRRLQRSFDEYVKGLGQGFAFALQYRRLAAEHMGRQLDPGWGRGRIVY